MGECSIYLFSLSVSPFGGNENPDPVTTHCGHLFHHLCLEDNGDHRCPQCRIPQAALRVIKIYPQVSNDVAELQQPVEKLRAEKAESENRVAELEEDLKAITFENDSRIRRGMPRMFIGGDKYKDSKCFNCESKIHESRNCPNPPYIRTDEKTTFRKHYKLRNYKCEAEMVGLDAGKIISKYEKKFHKTLNRTEIQVVFSFLFYDSICWNCGSAFHEKYDCPNLPVPGIKNMCKIMHLENHPLTDEEAERRYERKEHYTLKNVKPEESEPK